MLANDVPEADVQQGIAEGSINKCNLIPVTVLIYFYQNRNLTFHEMLFPTSNKDTRMMMLHKNSNIILRSS